MSRVLVVDDEPDLVDMMQIILETEGYEVVTANDGTEALAILDKTQIDLVITDLMMPELDGGELMAEIRKREGMSKLPVLLVTAGDGVEVAARFGARHLRKPFKLDTLLKTVTGLLGPR